MNIYKLSLSNLKFRALSNVLNVVILALGISLIATIFTLKNSVEQKFSQDLQGVDLVVGAKGSPLQLILSTVFQVDVPNGNIDFDEVENLRKNSLIKSLIPISLGDNYQGFRIVGTNSDYIKNYQGKLSQGRLFDDEMEVILGYDVAKKSNLKIGDKIAGAHGLGDSDEEHEESPYEVVGILEQSNSVLDRVLITSLESVWHVHHHEEEHENEAKKQDHEHEEKEITAALISYKTPLAIVSLPRQINQYSNLQSASPSLEMARLSRIFGVGFDSIKILAITLIMVAAGGFFITLFNIVNDSAYDIALMRSLGASRAKIFQFVLTQGVILSFIGSILGIVLSHFMMFCLAMWLIDSNNLILAKEFFSSSNLWIFFGAIWIGIFAALIPAILAYKSNIIKILSRR